ncbi:hypothetical protein PRIC2_004386 [Phytophthora ramorum]
MNSKSDISFLLNPQSNACSSALRVQMTPPMTPPPTAFARLAAMAQSPDATATSSLLLLGSCIAPLEKMSSCSSHSIVTRKTLVPALSLAALYPTAGGGTGAGRLNTTHQGKKTKFMLSPAHPS